MSGDAIIRKAAGIVLSVVMLTGLIGCAGGLFGSTNIGNGTHGSSISRAELYSSVQNLTDASDLVIIGRVIDTSVVQDIDGVTDFTLLRVSVLRTIHGDAGAAGNSAIIVRQTGSPSQGPSEALLAKDDVAMLFLVESGLSGDLAKQYYVTGVTAGLYRANVTAAALQSGAPLTTAQAFADGGAGTKLRFDRVDAESGDGLPASLTIADIQ